MGHAGLLHGQSACDGEKSIQTPGPGASENGGMISLRLAGQIRRFQATGTQ